LKLEAIGGFTQLVLCIANMTLQVSLVSAWHASDLAFQHRSILEVIRDFDVLLFVALL